MDDRIKKIKDRFQADGIESMVVCGGSDIKYLTGFTGDYGVSVLVLTPTKDYFVTDRRFEYQASIEVPSFETVVFKEGRGYYGEAGRLIHDLNLKRVAVQEDKLSHADYRKLAEWNPDVTFIPAPPYVSDLRQVKTPEELAIIRQACNITERSFYALLDFIKPGVTEIDVANELEYQFRSRGGSGFCFETIVASGPDNGANCHATPSMRKLEKGDFVTIDFGTRYNGYCSDMTRTVSIGTPKNPELLKIYDTVKRAKAEMAASLHAGLSMSELDTIGRRVVGEAGYTIPHGLGHGFGLDIHEDPFISASNHYRLEAGVVHTIEPGVYVPGVGGVRIEDDYLITDDGAECLMKVTNELVVL